MTPGRPVCGHPMKFYSLDRPRSDFAPFCHRPPHEGSRHMSGASWEHATRRQREVKAAKRRAAVLSGPRASVAA